jgi:hypothetical protein
MSAPFTITDLVLDKIQGERERLETFVATRTVLKESMQAHFDPSEPDHSSEARPENRRHTARKTIPQHY